MSAGNCDMASSVSMEEIAARVKELLADILDREPEEIPEDLPLFEAEHAADGLDVDSLDGLRLAVALANEYDLGEAAEMDYGRLRTVRDIAEYVHGLLPPGGEP